MNILKDALARLFPREKKFYKLMDDLAAQAGKGARHLKTFIESENAEEKAKAYEAVNRCREESKRLSAQITRELCATFITPFDPEDIQDFAISLYKICKTISKICDRLKMHNLVSEKGDFSRQTDLIVQEAEAMEDMVRELTSGHSDSARILQKVNVLHDLENKGDAALGELLSALFKNYTEARDLILRKDIYDMLEKVIDRYRDAAAVALQIVLKHS